MHAVLFINKLTRLEVDTEKWINIAGSKYYGVVERLFRDNAYLPFILWKDESPLKIMH